MDIKFGRLFNLAVERFKKRWPQMLGNGLLFGLLSSIILIVPLFLTYFVIFGLGYMFFTNMALAITLGIIVYIICIILMIMWMFFTIIGGVAVAEASFEFNGKLFEHIKRLFTKSNFKLYLKKLGLPIFGFYIIIAILPALLGLTSDSALFFGGLAFITTPLSILFGLFILYFSTPYFFALYLNGDAKSGIEILNARYTNMQMFKTMLVVQLVGFVIGIICSILMIIPFVSLIVMFVVAPAGVALVQALMIEIRIKVNGSWEPNPSPFPIYPPNNQQQYANNQQQFANGQTPPVAPVNQITPPPVQNSNQIAQSIMISSDVLTVTVSSLGAEIKSVIKDGKELMWQGDPQFWGRTSPVLFPFVGRLKGDMYSAGGKNINMPQHGFLRDRNFKLISHSANSATFEYTSSLSDFDLYPVNFTVQITYDVIGPKVTTSYNVINKSNYAMPYQIGAHPGFNVSSVDDLELVFPEQQATMHYMNDGLQSNTETVTLENVKLSYELINQNIPCYSKLTSKNLVVKQSGVDFLKFEFETMDYIAVWSPEYKNAKFVCIEPWAGICSRADQASYNLDDKDGMNKLEANSSAKYSYSFEVC